MKERDNPQSYLLKLGDEELTQKAFKMFDAGNGPIAVVEQSGVPPEKAKSLYYEYVELKALDLSKPSIPLCLRKIEEKLRRLDDGWYIIQSLVDAVNKNTSKNLQINGIDLRFLLLSAKEVFQHVNVSSYPATP
ncbi:MAG: hypothetical protein ABSB40_09785 [Nitrososphaeria archaeon]